MSKKDHKSSRKQAGERELAELRAELDRERRRSAALEREVAFLRRSLQDTASDYDQPIRWLRDKHATAKAEQRVIRRAEADRRHGRYTPTVKRSAPSDPKAEAKATERARMEDRMRVSASRRANHYRRRSYFRYMWEAVSDSLPMRILSQLLAYLRRLRLIQTVAGLVVVVLSLVLVTVVSAAALPFLIIGALVLALLALMRSKRQNHLLRQALDGKHLRILIPARGCDPFRENSFFLRQARAMAAEGGVAVLIVTPYALSVRGAGGHGAFFTARREGEDLYLVRRHYFFILRKRVLDVVDSDMTVIY